MTLAALRGIRPAAPCLLMCALQWVCGAASADIVISTPAPHVQSGQPLAIDMIITNDAQTPLTMEIPAELRITVEADEKIATIPFTPSRSGSITIAPAGFVRMQLAGTLASELKGQITLTTAGLDSNTLMVLVGVPLAAAADSAPLRSAEPEDNKVRVADKPPAPALSVYEPVYALLGGDGGLNAKLQFSFRYRLFDDKGPLARRLPWLDDLYLSFSQTSLWDLDDLSKPFKDSSYRPRFFFDSGAGMRLFDGRMRLRFEAGAGHESNGKDGDESRSFNMLYLRPTLVVGDPRGFRWYVSPLIHNYTAADENPDIADYRGYVDWQMGIGSRGGVDVWAVVRKGERSDFGSVELSVSYPLSKIGPGLSGWVLLQYFNGYGESLLDYRKKLDSQIRLGIGLAL